MSLMKKIRLSFFTLQYLTDKKVWNAFISDIEQYLGEKLTHLDINDPIRKKVVDIDSAADFICAFGEKDSYRMLDGKFGHRKITLKIYLQKDTSRTFSSIKFYFPNNILKTNKGKQSIIDVFSIGNKYLKPFYSYGEIVSQLVMKKSHTGLRVNLEAELFGIFWLTYFNEKYVDFFGREKIDQLPILKTKFKLDGVEFMFGELPNTPESIALREEAQKLLGTESFLEPDKRFDKPRGPQALTYDQLRS